MLCNLQLVLFWQKCIAVLTSAGNAPVFAVEVWPYLTSLPSCLYTPWDASPRITEAVVRRLTTRILPGPDRKSTRLNSSHANISYAVFCLNKLKKGPGEKGVTVDPEQLQTYQTDAEGNPYWFRTPEVAVFPKTTEEVAAVIKLAN